MFCGSLTARIGVKMKYFTKDYYNLMQCLGYTVCMKPIADKDYSDEDIAALYDKELKTRIARDRKAYDEPPQFIDINFEDAELEDFVFFDGETGTLKRPESLEEVRRKYAEEKARAEKDFANRPPFDPKQTVETFEAAYQGGLEHGYTRFPDWVKNEVDIRLIALGYLPKSVYNRLKTEQKQNKAAFDKIESEAKKVLGKESKKIPERILSQFGFHDGAVLSLTQSGEDLVMTVETYGVPFEGESPYTRVTFTNGKIIERDENLTFETRLFELNGVQCKSQCSWLYDELYKTESGYEAHMLIADKSLGYLTIACDDIVIEANTEIG